MIELGNGAYPYECIAKDKRPDDMIYACAEHKGWTTAHRHALDLAERNA